MPFTSKKAAQAYAAKQPELFEIDEFINKCTNDASLYKSAAERLLASFGEPQTIDTSKDPALSRIFSNRVITQYPAFKDFFGMEEAISKIVSYLKHSAQGLEESKQILYLLGPVGGGKSSLAEKLKELMQKQPIYRVAYVGPDFNGTLSEKNISPVNDSVFALLNAMPSESEKYDTLLDEACAEAGIRKAAVKRQKTASAWLKYHLDKAKGDLSQFRVQKVYPSILDRLGIAKTEPGDENNQDISALVGKVDIRQLERYEQNHPLAYSYSGSLNRANQGLMEFVEMFKAPIKVLHPLLTATQEGHYAPTEGMADIPFGGIILAHSNESEWKTFRNNKNNEAFLDRVYIVKVPYCLRVSEEMKIYQKLLDESELAGAPCAPSTLETMAQFSVLSRLIEPENSSIYSKMRVYDGESLKDTDPKAKSIQEYRDYAGIDEGMDGTSTRFAFKILSQVFNFDDSGEIAANPVHLFYVLEQQIEKEQFPQEVTEKLIEHLRGYLIPRYVQFIGKEIQEAYLESYSEYGQNLFNRYVTYADFWIQNQEYRDPETGTLFDRESLNAELEKIEKPAGISNPKDFRNEIVNFCLRARANNNGENPDWKSYSKLRVVIEKKMFSNTEDMLPVISFNAKGSESDQKKHDNFVKRMTEKGYTEKQVRLLCEWYLRVRKSS